MAAAVATVVDATFEWLVQSILGNFFNDKLEAWIRGHGVDLAVDVEELKAAMSSVQMVLAAAKGRKIYNELLARSLNDLRELLYDAGNLMEELDYYRLKEQVEKGDAEDDAPTAAQNTAALSKPSYSLLHQIGSTLMGILGKRKREDEHTDTVAANMHLHNLENKSELSLRMKHIVAELRHLDRGVSKALGIDISNFTGTSNLLQSTTQETVQSVTQEETTSYLVYPKVYGRDAEMESIRNLVASNNSSGITVLPIVGIGGVGKTTLARLVYNDPMVRSQFQTRIWVCVSNNFDVARLTKEMLGDVSEQRQSQTGSLNKLQEDLEKQMKSNRFLLVMDDVWDDMNEQSWNKLLAPLRCNQATGNMILITTRKISVADMTHTIEPIKLDALQGDDFWLLFKSCAFGDEKYEEDQRLCVMGKQIAEDLRGNPLAARTVGALLKRHINVDNWTNILNNKEWKSLKVKGGIMPVLKLSYDYLPEHLQQCFRYFCLFPKGYHFEETKLVRIWISQGFVHGSYTGKKLEDTGRVYVADLVNSGFFQHVSNTSRSFVLHDLMHDLACKVSRADFTTIYGLGNEEILPTTRHLSIVTDSAYCGKDLHGNAFSCENIEKKLLQVTSVRKLRSLVLIGHYDSSFFRCFKNIFKEAKNLRFLEIHATYSDFDCFISNLESCMHVRYIDAVFDELEDGVLPQALTNFFHLQVLDVGMDAYLTLPSGMSNLVSMQHLVAPEEVHSAIASIGKLTNLQELSKFKVQNAEEFDIRQLQFMSQLVRLGIYQLENVKSKQEATEARLIDKVYLEDFCLSWDNASSTRLGASTETATGVLEGLKPHQNLKHLQIIGYNGSISPSWLGTDLSVTSLRSLRLEKCKEWGVLPHLEKLLFLRKLELISMPTIVELVIPCLEELVLIELPRLEKCVAISRRELTYHLKALIIVKCPELKDFPPFIFQNSCSFQVHQTSGMSRLESNNAELSSAETEEEIWVCGLSALRIIGCPQIMLVHPLPPGPDTQVYIEGLATHPTIERSSGHLQVMTSDNLTVLDAKILAFQYLKDVTSLHIKNCGHLTSLSFEGFRQLLNLKKLKFSRCGYLVSRHCTVPNAVSESWKVTNCPAFPRLEHLNFKSCGPIAAKWLTTMLPHCPSLKELDVENYTVSLSILHPGQEAESSILHLSRGFLTVRQPFYVQSEFHLHLHIPLNFLLTLQTFHIKSQGTKLWITKGSGGFTSIMKLEISNCPVVLYYADGRFFLPPLIPDLRIPEHPTSLEKIMVGDNPNIQSLQQHSCTTLEELCIDPCRQMIALESLRYVAHIWILKIKINSVLFAAWVRKIQEREEGSSHIQTCFLPPSLEALEIYDLEEEIMPYLMARLTSLYELHVTDSPNLVSLKLSSCTALRKLYISNCTSLASLEGLQSLENITDLSVSLSPNLESLQLSSCTALRKLYIPYCKSLASLEGLQSLENITDLDVIQSMNIVLFLERMSQQASGHNLFPRLERLQIDAFALTKPFCNQLASLQSLEICDSDGTTFQFTDEQEEALQLLTSLQSLSFSCFYVLTDIPDVLHSLHSLKKLDLSGCLRISRLPEKGLPPSLEKLSLVFCSAELKEQCRMISTEKIKVETC